MRYQILALIAFNHLAAAYGLLHADPTWLILSAMGLILINKIGGEIGLHRYFCHRSFATSRFGHYLMLAMACLCCIGPPIAWVGMHRMHHKYSDTDMDPHGNLPAWRVWLTAWRPVVIEKRLLVDLLQDPAHMFVYRWYMWLIAAVYISLALICWQIPVFLISIPSVLTFHFAGLVNTVCHTTGHKPHDTNDRSHNNRLVNLLTWGSGLHNTHHAFPNRWDNRINPGDIDIPAVIIARFFIKRTR